MVTPAQHHEVVERLRAHPGEGSELRAFAMSLLDELDGYDWSGIYRLEGPTLVLDQYVGAPTDHTSIPIGVGVCGTAVAEDRNVTIEDVREVDNYLACSLDTRSEIVVLIRNGAVVLGQIDVDGHSVAAFDRSDEKMLEEMAQILADRW